MNIEPAKEADVPYLLFFSLGSYSRVTCLTST
jgi:hypothetical protein